MHTSKKLEIQTKVKDVNARTNINSFKMFIKNELVILIALEEIDEESFCSNSWSNESPWNKAGITCNKNVHGGICGLNEFYSVSTKELILIAIKMLHLTIHLLYLLTL